MAALGRGLLSPLPDFFSLRRKSRLDPAPLVINDLYAIIPAIKARGIAIVLVEQDVSRSLQGCADLATSRVFLEGRVSRTGRAAETNREELMPYYFGR